MKLHQILTEEDYGRFGLAGDGGYNRRNSLSYTAKPNQNSTGAVAPRQEYVPREYVTNFGWNYEDVQQTIGYHKNALKKYGNRENFPQEVEDQLKEMEDGISRTKAFYDKYKSVFPDSAVERNMNPRTAYNYALKHGPSEHVEKFLKDDPFYAKEYAINVKKDRFPAGEEAIANSQHITDYIKRVKNGNAMFGTVLKKNKNGRWAWAGNAG